jgi:hypothetical protein
MHVDLPVSTIRQLESNPRVKTYAVDIPLATSVATSVPLILTNATGSSSIASSYWHSSWSPRKLVNIDTGTVANFPLQGRVNHTYDGCFVTTSGSYTQGCPNGSPTYIAQGAAINCTSTNAVCEHGTHVSYVAVSNETSKGVVSSPNVEVLPLRVAAVHNNLVQTRVLQTDVERALDYVIDTLIVTQNLPVAAVTLSLGDGIVHTDDCTSQVTADEISTLTQTYRVAVVAAAGNIFSPGTTDGTNPAQYYGLHAPACVPDAISVASTNDNQWPIPTSQRDQPTVNVQTEGWYGGSNFFFSTLSHPSLNLFAPGARITTKNIADGTNSYQFGTSFSVPHVAGTFLRLRAKFPNKSIGWLLGQISAKCPARVDPRDSGIQAPRLCWDSSWSGQADYSF